MDWQQGSGGMTLQITIPYIMNKKRLTITLAATALALTPAMATDVFVYDTAHAQPVNSQTHLRSIVVQDGSLLINGEDGSQQEVAVTNFNYFRFTRKDQIVNSIADVKSLGLDVTFDGKSARVLGADKVTLVELFSSDGKMVGRLAPRSADFVYDLSALTPGVYIMRLHTAKGQSIRKITRK